jgi:hypothetical protein
MALLSLFRRKRATALLSSAISYPMNLEERSNSSLRPMASAAQLSFPASRHARAIKLPIPVRNRLTYSHEPRDGQRVEAVHQQCARRLRPHCGVEGQQIDLCVPEDWPKSTAMTRPLRSSPITGPSSLLRGSPPLSGASVLSASRLEPLVPFPLASPARFSRSAPEPDRASRWPDVARSVSGHPPSLSRRKGHPAVLTSPKPLSTLQKQLD